MEQVALGLSESLGLGPGEQLSAGMFSELDDTDDQATPSLRHSTLLVISQRCLFYVVLKWYASCI
jgi:hypothetical protein